MGKDKKKAAKKGKGAEKTAERTDKKAKAKLLKATGEDDIERMVSAIEEEEKRRKEVKEKQNVGPPSHRANCSLVGHPESNTELVMFGGEFHNGQKTLINNDLMFYSTKRKEWSQVISPGGPPPRCSHQAVVTAQGGGQMWIFGGEYASPSETQFHHYKDLWCYHFASRTWEKVNVSGGPSSRSGHRMVLQRRHLFVFGGFHDNGRDCKYFNDVAAFDLDNRKWKKLEIIGSAPNARSGCCLLALSDGRILMFGGYAREKDKKKKEAEKGVTMTDMFVLTPDKNDESYSKFRWQSVKQVGARPSERTGMCAAIAGADTNRAYAFGGVQDVKDDDEELEGNFYNDLYSVAIEPGETKATWTEVRLTGKRDPNVERRRRRKKEEKDSSGDDEGDGDVEDKIDELEIGEKEKTVTVEDGAFTITSTIGDASSLPTTQEESSAKKEEAPSPALSGPSPRFGSSMTVKGGVLYLYGGMVEDGDKQFTLKDFYSLDLHKLDEWQTLVESDLKSMEWIESDEWDSDEDDEDEEDEDDMDTE